MNHPIQLLMEQRRNGQNCGIESVCSANEYVLEVALRRSKLFNAPVLRLLQIRLTNSVVTLECIRRIFMIWC